MQASNIIELNGRGIPAILHSAKIVDVCAYLKSSGTPAALVLSDRGDVRGVLAEGDIIGAAGRLGSSVMQMMAGELMREQAPVCQSDTTIVEVLEVLGETASDFVLVTEGGVIKGLVTFQDVAELLTSAMAGGDAEAADVAAAAETAPVELQAPLQSAQEAPAGEVAASAVVAQTAAQQPEASVTVTGQDEVQFVAFDPAQVAPAAHAEMGATGTTDARGSTCTSGSRPASRATCSSARPCPARCDGGSGR
jgi:CBS domain-containing protein